MLVKKPVVLYGGRTAEKIGEAATLKEAAALAKGRGVKVDPELYASIVEYVGEGPNAYNVVREKGERIP
jgi:hypothetical protein